MGMIWYDSIHWYSIISSFIKIIHLSQVESGLLLVGDSSGLVRALPLGSLEATRGHDEKRCGDGVRLRSCVRSWNCQLAICQSVIFHGKAGRWSNLLWNIFSGMEIISSHYQSLLEISRSLTPSKCFSKKHISILSGWLSGWNSPKWQLQPLFHPFQTFGTFGP